MSFENFRTVMLRFDAETGEATIRGRVPVRGMRVVHEARNDRGDKILVVRTPGHSYASLDRRGYAPAAFEVFAVDYSTWDVQHGVPEEDAPWIRVESLARFPVQIGTKRDALRGS